MAKPATKALASIQSRHPAATILERHETSLVCDVGNGARALVSTIGAMHYRPSPGDPWVGIDTTWQASAGAWQYEMLNGPYRAGARLTLNSGEVLEYAARSGEWVRFQPLALNWRDENNSQQQIAVPQAVDALVTGADSDVLSWPAGYGPGRDFSWSAHPARLQKLLTIQSASDLPAPTVAGASVDLELTFAFTYDSTVTAFVDGVAWDRSTRVTTGAAIEFRSSSGETLWHFTAPKAWDSAGAETTGVMSFYRTGNTRHVAVRIPRAFVDASVFPLYLDPTVTVGVAAGADDGFVSYNDVATYTLNTTLSTARMGSLSTARYQVWHGFAVAVPQGASITDANVTYVHAVIGTGTLTDLDDFAITAEDVDDAAAVGGGRTAAQLWGAAHTTASVTWAYTTNAAAGTSFVTPDVKSVVQEVVDRTGWASGNNLNVRVTHPTILSANTYHAPASFEHATAAEPSLYVEYSSGTLVAALAGALTLARFTPTVTASEAVSVTLSPDGFISASGIVDQAAGTTNLHLAIDDSPDTSDGDTTYLVNSASASGHVWVELSNTPSDLGEMTTFSVRVRVRRES